MKKDLISRICGVLFLLFVFLVPAIIGSLILDTSDLTSLKSIAGIVLILASIVWVCLRTPLLLMMAKSTPRLNENFRARLPKASGLEQMKIKKLYFRKSWTLLASPIVIAVLVLLFSNDPSPAEFVQPVLMSGFLLDLMMFRSSLFTWFYQKDDVLYQFFLVIPWRKVRLSEARAYYWIGQGFLRKTTVFGRAVFLNAHLKPVATLPIEAYNFTGFRTELLSHCLVVPASLKL